MTEKNNDVPAINKMNLIFDLLATEHDSITQAYICSKLDLSKATVFRLINTLLRMGYLEQDNKGLYSLGAKLLTLGNIVNKRLDLTTIATPFIVNLSETLNEMVKLSIFRGEVVYPLICRESKTSMRITLDSGTVFPPYIGAAAKLLLALTPEGANYMKNILPSIRLKKYTKNTLSSLKEITDAVNKIILDEIAFDNGEESDGIYAIAARIYGSDGVVQAAVSIPFFGNYKEKKEEYLPFLKKCSNEISISMGYSK